MQRDPAPVGRPVGHFQVLRLVGPRRYPFGRIRTGERSGHGQAMVWQPCGHPNFANRLSGGEHMHGKPQRTSIYRAKALRSSSRPFVNKHGLFLVKCNQSQHLHNRWLAPAPPNSRCKTAPGMRADAWLASHAESACLGGAVTVDEEATCSSKFTTTYTTYYY